MSRGFPNPSGWGVKLITAMALLVMIPVSRVDLAWTVWLRQHRIPALTRFLDRTLFEGEGLGGGDPVIILLLLIAVAYYLAWKQVLRRHLLAWRPQLGFVLTTAVVCGIYLVHGLKWVLGRARPLLVFAEKALPFSDWYRFGPHFVSEGIFRGSFPSGHTVQAFLVMTFAYLLAGDNSRSPWRTTAGWLWGALSIVYALVMGMGRCMAYSHWVSDVLGGLFLAWICMHLLFYRVLQVPMQMRYWRTFQEHPPLPTVWELRLCGYLLAVVLGLMGATIGTRALVLWQAPALGGLIPLGLVLGTLGARSAGHLLATVGNTYAEGLGGSAGGSGYH
jgi:membrane-associated phospholipid phosphatase